MQTVDLKGGFATNDVSNMVECYEATLLGAPFRIYLHHSVRQTVCQESGAILSTTIPNLAGLKSAVALARSLHPRKMSASEIKFVRKAAGLKAIELANLLDISAEHLSRCEAGDRVLSGSAEKLFRIIVLTRMPAPVKDLEEILNSTKTEGIKPEVLDVVRQAVERYREALSSLESLIIKMPIQAAFDVAEELEFSFKLVEVSKELASAQDEEGKWEFDVAA